MWKKSEKKNNLRIMRNLQIKAWNSGQMIMKLYVAPQKQCLSSGRNSPHHWCDFVLTSVVFMEWFEEGPGFVENFVFLLLKLVYMYMLCHFSREIYFLWLGVYRDSWKEGISKQEESSLFPFVDPYLRDKHKRQTDLFCEVYSTLKCVNSSLPF